MTHTDATGHASRSTDTTAWLAAQLGELDRWRAELIDVASGGGASGGAASEGQDGGAGLLERVDDHRRWLETQLHALGATPAADF